MIDLRAYDVRMLQRLGDVQVTHGADSTMGIMDSADELLAQEQGRAGMIGRTVAVTIATDALPALKVGAAVTLTIKGAAKAYTVAGRLALDDGGLTRIACMPA